MLREAVARSPGRFGHEYFQERARTGGQADELWQAVADLGFLSVHLPEEYGGGGGGMSELAIVCEELAAQGCPLLLILVSAAICAELARPLRHRRAEGALAPGPRARGEKMVFAITEPDAGSNSHNLSTTATRDGDIYRLRGTEDLHLRRRRGGRDARRHAHRHRPRDRPRAQLSLFVVDTDAPGLERTLIPVEISAPEKQFQLFFDDVEVPADRLLGDEGEGLRQVFFGLNPERILERVALHRHRSLRARARVGVRERARGVGRADRPPPGRRAPARRSRRSSSSWRA